jgi:hypothetical protein
MIAWLAPLGRGFATCRHRWLVERSRSRPSTNFGDAQYAVLRIDDHRNLPAKLSGMATWELHDGNVQAGPFEEDHVIRMILHGIPPATLIRRVGAADWNGLRTHPPFAMALERRTGTPAVTAPGDMPAPAAEPPRQAMKLSKVPFVGSGCWVQGLGLLMPFILMPIVGIPIGALLGLVLMLILMISGRTMSTQWTCGACGNRLTGPDVKLCPACRAELR